MLDQFGVQQKLQVPPLDPTQKSILGGIVSVALYSASLAYFIYQIIDWQSNNKLPKYSTMKAKIDENEIINCPDVFAEIQYFQQLILENYIDPFDPKNLIFQPIFQIIPSDWSQIKIIDLDFVQEDQGGAFVNKYLIKNITLQGQPYYSKTLPKIEFQLSLKYCDQNELDINKFVCANETTKQNFFKQLNFFQIQINVEQFDIKSKQLKKIPKQFVINMVEGQMQYQEFSLQVNSLNLDDGFLFPAHNKINFFSDLKITSQQFDTNYSIKYYNQDLISVSYFQVDTLKEESTLEYPKISEILADTGSIITFIMQISFLVSKYNEILSVSKTKREIIQMYYSDYSQYQILKNWKGNVIGVQRDGEIYKQQTVLDFFTKIEYVAGLKINYINLQYELSKLQILVQSLVTAEQLKKLLKPHHLNQIGQLLSGIQGQEIKNTQCIHNKIIPSDEFLQKSNDKTEINNEIFDENIKKSIGLFLNNNEENDLQEKFSKSEIQVINIEGNSVL